ncbi:MAG: Maf family protein [Pseudomonadota bacterium]
MTVILASGSATRADMLRNAGLDLDTDPADLDETSMIAALTGDGDLSPEDVATVLAEAKASHVSARHPGFTVIGADQTLSLERRVFQKARSIEEARRNLLDLSGKTHGLHSAVAVARDGVIEWSYADTAWLTMRAMGPAEIGRYLARIGDDAMGSVGGYRIEGFGIQLFDRIDGAYWTILGLPLLPLLAFLREDGHLARSI